MSRPEPMVRMRCGTGSCRQIVLECSEPPKDWAGQVKIETCARHGGIRGHIFDEARRRNAKGLDPRPVLVLTYVRWESLRHTFYLADTTGKTQEIRVPRD